MTTIAENITRIQQAKADIKSAIEAKGVEVGDGLIDTYADKVAEISGGGGNLQTKNVTITSNGTSNVQPDEGYTGLSKVNITTNVAEPSQYNVLIDPSKQYTSSYGLNELITALDASKFDTSNYTNTSNMFKNCINLESVPLINTGNVTNMNSMFYGCSKITTIPLLNTSKVTGMSSTFYGCSKLTELPNIDTSKVTDFSSAFVNCVSLETAPNLDTSSMADSGFSATFKWCSKLKNVPLYDTSKITTMNSTFQSCAIVTIPQFDTSNVTQMNQTFATCSSLENVPLLNTSKVTSFFSTFISCKKLTDQSLDNILQMCINSAVTSNKMLTKLISVNGYQNPITSERIQALPHYQDFINAGWTIQ